MKDLNTEIILGIDFLTENKVKINLSSKEIKVVSDIQNQYWLILEIYAKLPSEAELRDENVEEVNKMIEEYRKCNPDIGSIPSGKHEIVLKDSPSLGQKPEEATLKDCPSLAYKTEEATLKNSPSFAQKPEEVTLMASPSLAQKPEEAQASKPSYHMEKQSNDAVESEDKEKPTKGKEEVEVKDVFVMPYPHQKEAILQIL
ncbi:hypothetical protein RF11_10044 [Thelohanellus kitauei]|uniref:Uncharacterized protein n=1 Tax=Thelohanellus kitauei TaxID=669202 RepID=A0A0C2JVC3_THEKT|nr:hypothetical protein RF11_10044 [Thelohanellus kitauei]